jgi:Fe-Mn family superoxide dismutase
VQSGKGEEMPFSLPALPYAFDALEPYIDKETMEIHYLRHHGNYVVNLNKALESAPQLASSSIEELLANSCAIVPDNIREAVRNNGGGHLNHSIFWQIMGPHKGGQPHGEIAEAIRSTFGGFNQFREKFSESAMKHFGSGWAWLAMNQSGKLNIFSTANQDSPASDGAYPIMGIDVWEHAYYLKYKNVRHEYVSNWWNVVNWDEIDIRFKRGLISFQRSPLPWFSALAGAAIAVGMLAFLNLVAAPDQGEQIPSLD